MTGEDFDEPFPPGVNRSLLELHGRVFSETWDVPDGVLDTVHERLLAWAGKEYGDLAISRPTRHEQFVTVGRIPPV